MNLRLYWKNPLKWFNPQMAGPITVEHNGSSVTSGQFSLFIASHIGVSRELHELISLDNKFLCEIIWWIHVNLNERLLSLGIYSLKPIELPWEIFLSKVFSGHFEGKKELPFPIHSDLHEEFCIKN